MSDEIQATPQGDVVDYNPDGGGKMLSGPRKKKLQNEDAGFIPHL